MALIWGYYIEKEDICGGKEGVGWRRKGVPDGD